MQTISSDKSLIYWMQNRNYVNFYPIDNLLLKENYYNLFKTLQTELENGPKLSFVDLWLKVVEKEIKTLWSKLERFKLNKNEIDQIVNKFRGNCGEIFAEAFFINGYMAKYCENDTYTPVDPTNERFIDATGVSPVDGLPIGIQVKNYRDFNLLSHEIFMKAAAEDDLWLRHDKIIPADKILQFISSPHQFLFSFTDSRDLLKEGYSNVVVLIGPDEIDEAKLQGDAKNCIPGKARFFQKIADEISLVC